MTERLNSMRLRTPLFSTADDGDEVILGVWPMGSSPRFDDIGGHRSLRAGRILYWETNLDKIFFG